MTIDLRSDTVTKPSATMLQAMTDAPLGDDVYGEDPTVNRLEKMAAECTGKQEALFCPSGTQANLLAQLSHCARGDEYIAGEDAHCYKYEAGAASVLGGLQAQILPFQKDGTLDVTQIKNRIKPDDSHFAITRLLCIENTVSGRVLPISYLENLADVKKQTGLCMHLDGARLFNAVVASNSSAENIAAVFDSVSFCLSKGLGAPVGSMLCASKETIARARRNRKLLGGGMRQAGILAAAGIYALKNNVVRLQEDHDKAAVLAHGLQRLEELEVTSVNTNMCFITMPSGKGKELVNYMKTKDILITPVYESSDCLRLVTHLDISSRDIVTFLRAMEHFCMQDGQR